MTDCPNADGSSERITQFAEQPPMCIDTTKDYSATMETSMGDMIIHLDAVSALATVNNFVFLSRYHYYDGLIFHRIINGFMCQGGCPEVPDGEDLVIVLRMNFPHQVDTKLVLSQWLMQGPTLMEANSSS